MPACAQQSVSVGMHACIHARMCTAIVPDLYTRVFVRAHAAAARLPAATSTTSTSAPASRYGTTHATSSTGVGVSMCAGVGKSLWDHPCDEFYRCGRVNVGRCGQVAMGPPMRRVLQVWAALTYERDRKERVPVVSVCTLNPEP
eukprot:362270-Chlamydomonas_euryale.AAC.9